MALEKYSFKDIQAAVIRIARDNKYTSMPTIADIVTVIEGTSMPTIAEIVAVIEGMEEQSEESSSQK